MGGECLVSLGVWCLVPVEDSVPEVRLRLSD